MTDDPAADDRREAIEEAADRGMEPGPNVEAMNFWDEVVADMEATADEYRDAGWDALELHPGDVTMIAGARADGRYGIDVLLPDDEYEELEALLSGEVAFDSYQVYRASQEGLVFAVIAMEDTDTDTAVVYPVYYDTDLADTNDVLDHARQEGRLVSYLRRLKGDYVELTHEDPSLFVPDEE